jgi:hypothetical protein
MTLQNYERLLAPARERFSASPGVQAVQSSHDAAFLESFLLHFCALGSHMTEPVEDWIRRAAERCLALKLLGLADALSAHARAEAGHHLMMIADVRSLATHWNTRRKPLVDAQRQYQQARVGYVRAEAQRYQDTIQLLVAMGGGWWGVDLTVANNNNDPRETHRD